MATGIVAAVLDLLAQPPREPLSVGPPTAGGWRVAVGGGMPPPADLGYVRFVKTVLVEDQAVVAIRYRDESASEWLDVMHLRRDDAGSWVLRGRSAGAGPDPVRTQPWANLGGGFGVDGGFAGGSVADNGLGVTTVVLTDAGGRVLEDRVENGVVCFLATEPMDDPIRVDLYDDHGVAVGHHESGVT